MEGQTVGWMEGPMEDQTVGWMEGPMEDQMVNQMVDRLVACSQGGGCFAIRRVGEAGLMVEAAELLP